MKKENTEVLTLDHDCLLYTSHVTTWNKNSSVKFRTDVAMMCKLGFDIKLADMSKDRCV